MNILIIGPGCHKCKTLAQLTEQAVAELGITAEITKVTDLKQIMALGVMMTPALVVDGTVKVSGRVPGIVEIKAMVCGATQTLLESGLSPADVINLIPVKPLAAMEPQVTETYRTCLPAIYQKIKP
jgi:small redox-active disulfide protein 2